MQESQRADPVSGIPIGESERSLEVGEFPAAEEPIAVGQFGVVLESTFSGQMGKFSGGIGPVLDRFGVPVVHLEGKDAAIGDSEAENPDE